MNLFLTNASGYVGSAVALALLGRGHSVTALARSQATAQRLQTLGITPIQADLRDLGTYAPAVRTADAIIHTAFEYLPDGGENTALDRETVAALLQIAGQDRRQHLLYTSNVYLPGVRSESAVAVAEGIPAEALGRGWRLAVEQRVLQAQSTTLSTAVLRLGMVYGEADGGTISDLIGTTRRLGWLPYLESMADCQWSLIARPDLADLYAEISTQKATGVFHGVDGQAMTVAAVCQLLAAHTGTVARACRNDEAQGQLSEHAFAVMHRSIAAAAPRARALGWQPRFASLREGLRLL